MNAVNRPAYGAALIFGALLLLLNIPNLMWVSPNQSLLLNGVEYLERLWQCLLLSALFLTLFAKPARACLALWLLCLWWMPVALAVRAVNGAPIDATLIGMAAATSPAELLNLIGALSLHWFVFFVLWNGVIFWVWHRLSRHPEWVWSSEFRGKIILFSVAMLLLPYLLAPREPSVPVVQASELSSAVESKQRFGSGHPLHSFTQADKRVGAAEHLPDAFPYELPWAVAQYLQGRRVVDAVRENLALPVPAAQLAAEAAQAEVVVLVIGESSTRNAWHWFNTQAPATTPRLEARAAQGQALFGFGNTLAQTASTRQAVPSMLTAQPLIWPNGEPNPQATRSIVWVAAQAGYATAWFSNQAAVGEHDGIIASYAQEAAAVAFLNPAGFASQGSLDAVLLPALRRQLSENKKTFVVLHTMGSHFNYHYRYPSGFGVFSPASTPREAYFNSVAYTDWLLDQIMGMLEADGRRAALVYTADHGETIPDGVCEKGAANRTTRDTYEVPALVWLSASYQAAFPLLAEQLRTQQSQPYAVAAVHSTLLDIMRGEADTPLADRELQSFARPSVRVDDLGREIMPAWTEQFTAAVQKNPCFMILR